MTVSTMDLLPTIMDLLGNVSRPAAQAGWALDGTSVLPVLRGEALPARGMGWAYMAADPATAELGYGYRFGKWKLVVGGASCRQASCKRPMLFDLDADLGERHDLAAAHPDVIKALLANFSQWQGSVRASRQHESQCKTNPTGMAPCVRRSAAGVREGQGWRSVQL